MFERKQNVFDDFIAAADFLIKEKYATSRTLGDHGRVERRTAGWSGDAAAARPVCRGAAGGWRHGHAALSQVHRRVGVGDGVRIVRRAKGFGYLSKYSPLHNVKAGTCYPATLVTTADHDDRVVPSHSFKFAAATQAAQGCAKPILIRVETQGSHGYRPTDRRIAELADEWAFALAHLRPTS
jgi:prolyl oligopeptidase